MENYDSYVPEEEMEQETLVEEVVVEETTVEKIAAEEMPSPCFQPDEPERKRTKKKKGGKAALAVVFAIALVFVSCAATAFCMNLIWEKKIQKYYSGMNNTLSDFREEMGNNQKPTVALPDGEAVTGELNPAQVYAMNVNAVVAISNQGLTTNFFGQTSETASSGSGFIISADGYIVSNYHVVSGANTLVVITADGKEYDAKLVGYDESNDLSVLKIDAENLTFAKLGSSDTLVEGDRVAAIGNPLGELTSTLTVGYISAKGRRVNTDGTSMEMLQTDAAINSGNSGGPLFNMKGEVVGITTAKYSGTSNSGATIEGIGFAIPIDDVKGMIDDLKEFGYIKSGYLGVMVQDVAVSAAQQYGLPLGALIVEVTPGGCADKAGVKAKDIVTNLGSTKVESMSDLTRALGKYDGGEEVVITVYRSGKTLHLTAKLDSKPKAQEQPQPQPTQPNQGGMDFDWFNPFG